MCLLIHFSFHSLLDHSWLFPPTILPTILSPSPLSRWGPPGYPVTQLSQVSVRLGASSPTKARQSTQLLEDIPYTGNHFWDRPHSNCWKPRVKVSWLCWSFCRVHIPFGAHNPSFYSSIRIPKLHPLYGYGCLHLSESATGRALSEDNIFLSVNITGYH